MMADYQAGLSTGIEMMRTRALQKISDLYHMGGVGDDVAVLLVAYDQIDKTQVGEVKSCERT